MPLRRRLPAMMLKEASNRIRQAVWEAAGSSRPPGSLHDKRDPVARGGFNAESLELPKYRSRPPAQLSHREPLALSGVSLSLKFRTKRGFKSGIRARQL